ncbi:hypothetical protein T265_00513 [Opisthorchis viverrini]|uniref:Uncharacterized protein n=1 Tax=Opisthorchis viverrini TaxID=6198 RepID=A0A075A5P4_OPIVI|nr:hypothetical protein T265_00513 [Opisthorchis viverrini]KER33622.1 hypothetical protein T265_00513 [Opisthorchis viverrini]
MCCTRPPHASATAIFEISRYMYICNALLIRLLKIRRQPMTGFAFLSRAHQVVPSAGEKRLTEGNTITIFRTSECESKSYSGPTLFKRDFLTLIQAV